MQSNMQTIALCLSPDMLRCESSIIAQAAKQGLPIKIYHDGSMPAKVNERYVSRFRYHFSWMVQHLVRRDEFKSPAEHSLAMSLKHDKVGAVVADSAHTALSIRHICQYLGIPLVAVLSESDTAFGIPDKQDPTGYKQLYETSRLLVVRSERESELLIRAGVAAEKIVVDTADTNGDFCLVDVESNVLMPLRMSAFGPGDVRAAPVVLPAFDALRKKHPQARLIVAGDEHVVQQSRTLVDHLALKDSVSFIGPHHRMNSTTAFRCAQALVEHPLGTKPTRPDVDQIALSMSQMGNVNPGFVIAGDTVAGVTAQMSQLLETEVVGSKVDTVSRSLIPHSFRVLKPLQAADTTKDEKRKIKVALLVAEFFSNSLPFANGKGGYGILARNYIAEYIPDAEIELDTILGFNSTDKLLTVIKDEDKKVVFLPTPFSADADKYLTNIINEYDLFISIEFQAIAEEVMSRTNRNQRLIMWTQAPCTDRDWAFIDTVTLTPMALYPVSHPAWRLLQQLFLEGRLVAISQGRFLIGKARESYRLPAFFDAEFVPNPVQVRSVSEDELLTKKDMVIALARLDGIKRPWIIAEVAKRLPNYQFVFLGQTHEGLMKQIMAPYADVSNIVFAGQTEGEAKDRYLRQAKLLINSSISEAVPVSFLEALGYGVPIVSNQDPDDIVSKFGIAIESKPGDGFDMVDDFAEAIDKLMTDDQLRLNLARSAVEYVSEVHSIPKFVENLKGVIKESA